MPVVFHPHGWIRNDQLVEFVDYAVEKYGSRVKFLNFAECLERINTHLLGGVALRTDGAPADQSKDLPGGAARNAQRDEPG